MQKHALAFLGVDPSRNAACTDANRPMLLGISSNRISRGRIGEHSHSIDEYGMVQDQQIGAQTALLIALLEAGARDKCPGSR